MQQFILPKGERNLARLFGFLSALAGDRAWKIEVSEHRRTRSNEQNAYLWAIYEHILRSSVDLAGWTKDDLHEFFLGNHFGWETLEGFGRRRMRPLRRSSRLTTTEFSEFVESIQRFMAERGVYVEDPQQRAA